MDYLLKGGQSDEDIEQSVERAGLSDDDEFFPFMFSDATPDRMDDTIDAKGWELGNFQKNPVILWAHDADQQPVGKSVSTFVRDGEQLVGVVQFAGTDFAQEVKELYKGGFMNAVSVGFQPKEWEFSERSDWALDFKRQELLETSAVPVPAHAGALLEGRKRGYKRFVEAMELQLENLSDEALAQEIARRSADNNEQMNIPLDQIVREEFAKADITGIWKQHLAKLNTSLTGKID